MMITYQDEKEVWKQADHALFAEQVSRYQNDSENGKSQFLQKENLEHFRSISIISEFIALFYQFYQSNSLCFSEEVRNAYNELLNDSYVYKWNIPMNDIAKKIDDINNAGVIYIPINAGMLLSIHTVNVNIGAYFKKEFISIIARSQRFQDSNPDFIQKLIEGFDLGVVTKNFLRRRDYHRKKSRLDSRTKRQTGPDRDLNELFDQIDFNSVISKTEADGKETKKLVNKIQKGRMENEYLKMLFEMTLFDQCHNEIEKYAAFYQLLQFLLHDKAGEIFKLYTKDEFDEKCLKYEGKDVYYDNDYKKYQKAIVERIIGL